MGEIGKILLSIMVGITIMCESIAANVWRFVMDKQAVLNRLNNSIEEIKQRFSILVQAFNYAKKEI